MPSSVRLNAAPVVSMTRYIVSPRSGTTEHTARYCNSGGTVSLPDAPDALSGQAFDGWFDGDTEFTEATVISSDMTLNARFSNILVSSIRLSSASLTLQVGSTHTLTATVEPEGAANRGITWSSSDTSVATVGDNGLVTAAGVGTATITAAAQDGSGVSAECTVTVTPLPTYTVTVNDSYAVQSGAGSYVEGASVTVSAGERSGYRFAGWTAEGVDLADAGAATVTFNMPAHGVTLTAGWDYINVPDPTYKPIVDVPEGVEVTTDPARPEPGDTVTVTTDPAGSISVTDKDGNPVEVTRNPDGSWSFTQPEGAVTITFTPDSGLPFTDVADGDWYYDAVSYVYANGLMDGVSGTTFEPNANMTRAMVWAILARIDGETVTGANWVETAREWAMANGVSDGTDHNGNVTREQLATMLWRYAGEPASDYSLSAFTDADSVSDYAATATAWAVEHGIITGVTDTTLVPQGTATRAQCAAMLMRFAENVK